MANLEQATPDTEPDTKEMQDLLLRVMRGANGQAFRIFGNRVHGGPFMGMVIPERNIFWDDGNSGTKLFGTYEHELHPIIDHAAWRAPKAIVNIGCAEGYYAVGMARILPQVIVYAFDLVEGSLGLCREYAGNNGVADRVKTIIGCETPQQMTLLGLPFPRLYIMDVEGAELRLVDLEKCPALQHSDLIIECHDVLQAGLSIEIADRLCATHRVEVIRPRMPNLEQFPLLRQSPTIMTVLVATEKRPMPCCWLACWANTRRKGE